MEGPETNISVQTAFINDIVNKTGKLIRFGNLEQDDSEYTYVFDLIPLRVALFILYSLVFFFCFFGNAAVILVTTFHHKMRNTTKFFLAHLAVANLCVGVFCIYQHLSIYLIQTWIFGIFLCKMYHFTIGLSHAASVLILVVTAVEKYIVIVHPLKSRWLLTKRRKQAVVAAVWLCGGILSFHKFYYVTLMEHRLSSADLEIICAMDVTDFDHKLADLITLILLFLLPMLIITVLYLRIALFLSNRGKRWYVLEMQNIRIAMTPNAVASSNPGSSTDLKWNWQAKRGQGLFPSDLVPACVPLRKSQSGPAGFSQHDSVQSFNSCETTAAGQRVRVTINGGGIRTRPFSSRNSAQYCRAHRAAVKTLMVVAICFAICNSPFYVQKILQNYFSLYDGDNPWLELLAPLSFLMMCINCALNPFIHALLNRNFQRCLLEVLTRKHRR